MEFINCRTVVLFWVIFYGTLEHCHGGPEGNIVSAIAHMEPLVDIERRLINIARDYLNKERQNLNGLKQFAESVEEAMELSKDEPLKYLGNPVNSYLIIKRFTSGWGTLGDRLTVDDKKIKDIETLLKSNEMYLPTYDKDLVGATNAILRLQDTYGIKAYELSEGKINGTVKPAHQMTAQDCLDIANIAHNQKRYVRMMDWLLEAGRIINDPTQSHRRGNATTIEVNEFLAWGYYLSNNMHEALRYTNLVLREDPTNQKNKENRRIYSWFVERNLKGTEKETTYMELANKLLTVFREQEYVKSCNDEHPTLLKIKNPSMLSCFVKQQSPQLILKPIKVTQVHDNPEIYMLHDILTKTQMRKLKEIATPRMKTARIIHPENDDFVEAPYRVAKTMFLNTYSSEYERMLDRKLNSWFSEITGLDLETSEQLQMNNYGLGGQYEFHHDYGFEGSLLHSHEDGNRIATVLVYMSDVERGGQTVFTKLGLSIPPKEGDAVFWYNLYRNGTGIWDTEHASCPVVSGSKWVANKWIRERGNEFKRKCSLNRYE